MMESTSLIELDKMNIIFSSVTKASKPSSSKSSSGETRQTQNSHSQKRSSFARLSSTASTASSMRNSETIMSPTSPTSPGVMPGCENESDRSSQSSGAAASCSEEIFETSSTVTSSESSGSGSEIGQGKEKLKNKGRQDLLACSVCLEAYDDCRRKPRFLSCHHSYCERCLETISKSHQYKSILCPNCRTITELAEVGVQGLQINFYVDYMRNYLQENGLSDTGCRLHSLQPQSFFCLTCRQSVCRDCLLIDHTPGEKHDVKSSFEAESDLRQTLTSELRIYLTSLDSMTSRIESHKKRLRILDSSKQLALDDLNETFNRIINNFESRRQQLRSNLMRCYDSSKQDMLEKLKDLQKVLDQAELCLSSSSSAVQGGNLLELSSSIDSLKQTFKQIDDRLKENEQIHIKCITFTVQVTEKENDKDMINSLGTISEKLLSCSVEFVSKSRMVAGLCGEISIVLLDECLDSFLINSKMFGAQIIDPLGDNINSTIAFDDVKSYSVKFCSQVSGEHKITLTIHGEPIPTSEYHFTVESNEPIWRLGGLGEGSGLFKTPRNVVIDSSGNMYVADTGNKLIQKFDSDGKFQQEFKVGITNEAVDLSTCDLSLGANGKFVICTETKVGSATKASLGNTVTIYSIRGTLLRKFTDITMKCGLCLATNSKREIIVSDYLLHCLLVYSHEGALLRRIGYPDHLDHPSFVCVDPLDNSIIVTDTNRHSVVIFDSDGKFKYRFGSHGKGKGQLNQPFGVALDADGHILVADSGNNRIQVFSRDGTFISVIESKTDPLNQPRGLNITREGHVIVADRDNHCIKCYKFKGTS